MRSSISLLFVALLTISLACDEPSAEDDAPDETDETAEEQPEEEAAQIEDELQVIEHQDLSLRGMLPTDAKIENIQGMGMGVSVTATDLSVNISTAKGSVLTADFDQAQDTAVETFRAGNIEAEELDDGWLMRFTTHTGGETEYWVQSFRNIGDDDIICATSVEDENIRDRAETVCRSLQE